MSELIDFYGGDAPDCEGRTLRMLLGRNDGELEFSHDVIQWLFPLNEPSNFNDDAPVLDAEDILLFNNLPALRKNLKESFDRFMRFLGLRPGEHGDLVPADNYDSRFRAVWAEFNHNHLRITRVLKSMRLLGLPECTAALYAHCRAVFASGRHRIPENTFRYWTAAAGGPLGTI